MPAPANQAAANLQAMQESFASFRYAAAVPNAGALALATTALTADDWTGGAHDAYVYDPQDAGTWTAAYAARSGKNHVFNARSGPMKDPYGGGWAGNQFT